MFQPSVRRVVVIGALAAASLTVAVLPATAGASPSRPATGMSSQPSSTKAKAKTIVGVAVANPDFSTLVTAVKQAGLVGALKGKGPYTVFAPTNEAFAKIPADQLNALLADKAKLTAVFDVPRAQGPRAVVLAQGNPDGPHPRRRNDHHQRRRRQGHDHRRTGQHLQHRHDRREGQERCDPRHRHGFAPAQLLTHSQYAALGQANPAWPRSVLHSWGWAVTASSAEQNIRVRGRAPALGPPLAARAAVLFWAVPSRSGVPSGTVTSLPFPPISRFDAPAGGVTRREEALANYHPFFDLLTGIASANQPPRPSSLGASEMEPQP